MSKSSFYLVSYLVKLFIGAKPATKALYPCMLCSGRLVALPFLKRILMVRLSMVVVSWVVFLPLCERGFIYSRRNHSVKELSTKPKCKKRASKRLPSACHFTGSTTIHKCECHASAKEIWCRRKHPTPSKQFVLRVNISSQKYDNDKRF